MKAFLTVDIHSCDEYIADHVGFHFDADDLAKWKKAALPCKELNATYISFPDYRCMFFEDNGDLVDFRADGCSVAVFGNQNGQEFIRFSGFEKHPDVESREWFTDRIYFTELELTLAQDTEAAKETDQ